MIIHKSHKKNDIKIMLLKEFSHLSKFYKNKKDFKKDLFSGEVKISIKDLVTLLENKPNKPKK